MDVVTLDFFLSVINDVETAWDYDLAVWSTTALCKDGAVGSWLVRLWWVVMSSFLKISSNNGQRPTRVFETKLSEWYTTVSCVEGAVGSWWLRSSMSWQETSSSLEFVGKPYYVDHWTCSSSHSSFSSSFYFCTWLGRSVVVSVLPGTKKIVIIDPESVAAAIRTSYSPRMVAVNSCSIT